MKSYIFVLRKKVVVFVLFGFSFFFNDSPVKGQVLTRVFISNISQNCTYWHLLRLEYQLRKHP